MERGPSYILEVVKTLYGIPSLCAEGSQPIPARGSFAELLEEG